MRLLSYRYLLIHCNTYFYQLRTVSSRARVRKIPKDGKTLHSFMSPTNSPINSNTYSNIDIVDPSRSIQELTQGRSYYIETYGCQMNISDTEIVEAILQKSGLEKINQPEKSDLILINTCSIRDNAEQKVWNRLNFFKSIKRKRSRKNSKKPPPVIGVLGCMAERLKKKLIHADKMVDLVAGPDAYKDLPRLLSVVDEGETAVNTMLTLDETYRDITPVRHSTNRLSAFVSIMRGCNQYCSYCIVPFTRGKERSRDMSSITQEIQALSDQGFKEVTLLGQNVNAYNDISTLRIELANNGLRPVLTKESRSPGFNNASRRVDGGVEFVELLDQVSKINPEIRFRFTSPHPKDFPDSLLYLIRDRANICNQIHLPLQSGSSEVLKRMKRGYTQEAYLNLVQRIRNIIGEDVGLSTDIITGFCGETDEDHKKTLDVMRQVQFDTAFMFKYSEREKNYSS